MTNERTVLDGLQPGDLGFSFKEYRAIQLEAIEQAVFSDEPVQGLGLPPGSGKSLVAVSAAKLNGGRTAILTSTKGLQNQYLRDFYGQVADIRGRGNYPCPVAGNCEDGAGEDCRDACPYLMAYRNAVQAPVIVANYAYWLSVWEYGQGLGDFDLLICDEAVQAPEHLSRFLAIHVTEQECRQLRIVEMPPETPHEEKWDIWVRETRVLAGKAILDLENRVLTPVWLDRLKRWKRLQEKLSRFPGNTGGWVFEYREGQSWGKSWEWDPVSIASSGRMLTRGISRVVLMSATLKKKVLDGLGLKGEFKEWGRIFPAERNPIYLCPPRVNGRAVRLDYRTTGEDLRAWVEHIDRILDARLDRKALIHSVSYERQRYLVANSRHKTIMLGNSGDPDSESSSEVAERFRRMPAPAVLVSPSFGTGWDFPMEQCELVIIGKVPFQPAQSILVKARTKADPEFPYYMALQDLVQSSGRGMRSISDSCEVFVTDGHFAWLLGKYKHLVPRWFQQAVYSVNAIPQPLPALKEQKTNEAKTG